MYQLMGAIAVAGFIFLLLSLAAARKDKVAFGNPALPDSEGEVERVGNPSRTDPLPPRFVAECVNEETLGEVGCLDAVDWQEDASYGG